MSRGAEDRRPGPKERRAMTGDRGPATIDGGSGTGTARAMRVVRGGRWTRSLAAAALVAALVLVVVACRPDAGESGARVVPAAEVASAEGFSRAEGPQTLVFPADHGPHPDFQTEWWYVTGNLETADGRHFGYQLTFFRRALVPPAERAARASDWAADQIYMAHLALSDVAGRDFQAVERFSRGAAGLAGAQAVPFMVWLEDWSIAETEAGDWRLQAAAEGLSLDLTLRDTKGPILQGDRGYSRKGPEPGNASYYYSLTRLETAGSVQVAGETYRVTGLSWMDHEYSTSALSAGQVGWDWFSLQLADGSELVVFQIRRDDGSIDPYSSGTLVAAGGGTVTLARDDFEITVERTWRSPHTGADYPAGWAIRVPSANLTLRLEPYLADQELNVSYAYWEGAVRFTGEQDGRPVNGDGFVELTGYAGSMQGQF
jgi:predicted secreted hydrolase